MNDFFSLKHMLFTVAITMPRIVVAFTVVPILSGQLIQGYIKHSIFLSFMFILYPLISPTITGELTSIVIFMAVILKEAAIGLLIGFLCAIIFWVAVNVGFAIDNQRGATIANVIDPISGEQTSPMGSIMFQFVIVLFFTSGSFLTFLGVVFESYRIWPIYAFTPAFSSTLPLYFLQILDFVMELTLVLAAPALICMLISTIGLGLINRFSPQLNVFFISMPIKSGISILFMVVYLPFLVSYIKIHFNRISVILHTLKGLIE